MRAFLVRLGREAGHQIELGRIAPKPWNDASRQSFLATSDALRDVVRLAIVERKPAKQPGLRDVSPMADPPRDVQAAKRRASFARSERLRRERMAGQQSNNQAKKRDPAKPASRSAEIRAALREREQRLVELAKTPEQKQRIRRMFAGYHRDLKRDDDYRVRIEAKRQERAKAQDRKDKDQRSERVKRQQAAKAAVQRGHDRQRVQRQQKDEQRRGEQRKASNRRAAAAKQRTHKEAEQKRQAILKELAAKAKAAVEQDQKRRAAEQLAQQRRETEALRHKHKRDRDSFRSNETMALERHHGAMKRLDAAEQRALDASDGKRTGLPGAIRSLVPGSRKRAEAERQQIRDGYEAERIKRHRDLETLKERQFTAQQSMRIDQAKQRLEMMTGHRAEALQFKQHQDAEKPRQVEARQAAMAAAQEQTRAQERQPTRESWQLREMTDTFNRAH